jgi:membrane protein CcdC involved in cytochrome C biogenesis
VIKILERRNESGGHVIMPQVLFAKDADFYTLSFFKVADEKHLEAVTHGNLFRGEGMIVR